MSRYDTDPVRSPSSGSQRLVEVVPFVAFQTRPVFGRYADGEIALDGRSEMDRPTPLGEAVDDTGELEARYFSCDDCDWTGTEIPADD